MCVCPPPPLSRTAMQRRPCPSAGTRDVMAVPLTNMSFFQLSPSKEQCHEPLVQLSFIFELSSFTVLLSRRAHLHELWNLRYFSAIFPLTPLHLKKKCMYNRQDSNDFASKLCK